MNGEAGACLKIDMQNVSFDVRSSDSKLTFMPGHFLPSFIIFHVNRFYSSLYANFHTDKRGSHSVLRDHLFL